MRMFDHAGAGLPGDHNDVTGAGPAGRPIGPRRRAHLKHVPIGISSPSAGIAQPARRAYYQRLRDGAGRAKGYQALDGWPVTTKKGKKKRLSKSGADPPARADQPSIVAPLSDGGVDDRSPPRPIIEVLRKEIDTQLSSRKSRAAFDFETIDLEPAPRTRRWRRFPSTTGSAGPRLQPGRSAPHTDRLDEGAAPECPPGRPGPSQRPGSGAEDPLQGRAPTRARIDRARRSRCHSAIMAAPG